MKKIMLILSLLVFANPIFTQNVGIGTPTALAPLHIKATGSEVVRIEGNAPYLSVYDITAGYRGYIWSPGDRFELGSSFGSNLPVTIAPNNTVSATFLPNGNVGIGNPTPVYKLDVSGDLNISSGVLRVDGLPIVQNPQIGFAGVLASNQIIPHNSFTYLGSYLLGYNEGGGFDISTGIFTAPSAGLYHFHATVYWSAPAASASVILEFVTGGVTFSGSRIKNNISSGSTSSESHSYGMKLLAGNTVQLRVHQIDGGASMSALGGTGAATTLFSGYKVY